MNKDRVNRDFIHACYADDLDRVKSLIADSGADYNYHNGTSYQSGLYIACYKGYNDLVLYLLSLPNIDYNMKPYASSPFSLACNNCNMAVIRRFMEMPNLLDGDKSVYNGHYRCAKLLMDTQAELIVTKSKLALSLSKYTQNDLSVACQKGNLDMIKLIIEHAPDISYNFQDVYNLGCLAIACYNGYNDIAMYLLSLPYIDYNDSKSYYNGPLINACLRCNRDVIRRLLEFPDITVGMHLTVPTLYVIYPKLSIREKCIMYVIRALVSKL